MQWEGVLKLRIHPTYWSNDDGDEGTWEEVVGGDNEGYGDEDGDDTPEETPPESGTGTLDGTGSLKS